MALCSGLRKRSVKKEVLALPKELCHMGRSISCSGSRNGLNICFVRMILFPKLGKIFPPVSNVFIIFVFVLAVLNQLITGSVLPHERIECRRLQPGDPLYEGLCKPVVHVFFTFLPFQAFLEGLHPADLPALE